MTVKPIEFRDDQVIPEVDDFKLACIVAADLDGRTSPGNVVNVYAQWIATLREHYVAIGRELGRDEK